MIITIDGPVATGKSTIARKLAESLGYIYFDTGAMYRAITYALLRNGIEISNQEGLKKYLEKFSFDIKVKNREKRYFVDGEDITEKIRGQEVTSKVSEVSAHPLVRQKLVALQREEAEGVNAVFEGRDMGTVVFPNANIKVFLTGRPEVRARRRYEETVNRFPDLVDTLSLQNVLDDIVKRDQYDTSRTESPLKKADDAYLIDTSDFSPDEIVFKILEYKDSKKAHKKPTREQK